MPRINETTGTRNVKPSTIEANPRTIEAMLMPRG
ncbi:hypothetical protein ABIA36_001598 [Leifsonia sp. EB34]